MLQKREPERVDRMTFPQEIHDAAGTADEPAGLELAAREKERGTVELILRVCAAFGELAVAPPHAPCELGTSGLSCRSHVLRDLQGALEFGIVDVVGLVRLTARRVHVAKPWISSKS
jgi:hypothetical protein